MLITMGPYYIRERSNYLRGSIDLLLFLFFFSFLPSFFPFFSFLCFFFFFSMWLEMPYFHVSLITVLEFKNISLVDLLFP
jgi:hypothetical protein